MSSYAELGLARAAINEAALDTGRWPDALGCIAAAAGANGAAIFAVDPASEPLAQGFGTATDGVHEYVDRWSDADPWFAHLISLKVASGVAMGSHGTHLSLYRPANRNDFGSEERAVLRSLWPAVRRAVNVHSLPAGSGLTAAEQAAEASLDTLPFPAWVVGDGIVVRFQNRAAAQWLAAERAASTAFGALRAIGTLDAAALTQALAIAKGGSSSALVTALPAQPLPRRAVLHVTPLAAPLHAVWPRGVALLMLKLPSERAESGLWLQHLKAIYRLTSAEANVLRHLAEGLSTVEVADLLEVSYATVRGHLLALYQKTGCRRQAQLVRLSL